MQTVATTTDGTIWGDLLVVAGFTVAGLALGALTLRRQTA